MLNKGADVNAQGGYYSNALNGGGDYKQIVKLLLDKSADINAQTSAHKVRNMVT